MDNVEVPFAPVMFQVLFVIVVVKLWRVPVYDDRTITITSRYAAVR
jgi:hypothetical protein